MSQRSRVWLGVASAMVLAYGCNGNEESSPEGTATQTIDTKGGSIETISGAKVVVPANGVTVPVALTVAPKAVADVKTTLPSDVAYAGQPVAFTPYDVTFSVPVTISIPADGGANVVLALANESNAKWQEIPGAQFSGRLATFQWKQFGLFAACRRSPTSGMGGASSTGQGGAVATGGKPNSSSTMGQGGATATSTSVLSGGTFGLGGAVTVPASGGTPATGGATSKGGAAAAGGSIATGGATAKGGTSATGGSIAKGGSISTGGAVTAGGSSGAASTVSTGGVVATGGQTAKGGTSSGVGGSQATAGTTSAGTAGVSGSSQAGTAGTAGAAACLIADNLTTCQLCLAQKCCAQQSACEAAADTQCPFFYTCFSKSGNGYSACVSDMAKPVAPSITTLYNCATSQCATACGVAPAG